MKSSLFLFFDDVHDDGQLVFIDGNLFHTLEILRLRDIRDLPYSFCVLMIRVDERMRKKGKNRL